MAPTLHTSVRASMEVSPRACSGDMYQGVPNTMPVCVRWMWSSSSVTFAMPKSMTFGTTRPSSVSLRKTFSGLMSRCTMPASWAATRASITGCAMAMADSGERLPSSLRQPATSVPRRYSCTMKRVRSRSSWPTAYTSTMFGWPMRAAARASRSKRRTRSSRSYRSSRNVLSATGMWFSRSSARYTAPIPPFPRVFSMR